MLLDLFSFIHPPYLMVFIDVFAFFFLLGIILFCKFIYPKKNIHPLLLVILLSILPMLSMIRGGVPDSHDFILHTVLASQFFASLSEGNLAPQWGDGSPGGYGYPVFVYFYHIPYYLWAIFKFLGFGLIDSSKLVLSSTFIISGIAMYLWAKDEFGRWGAVIATIFYQFTPYHLIETHTFTAFGEVAAFALMPFTFFFIRRFILTQKYKWFVATAVSFALSIISHHSLGLIGLPLLLIYSIVICRVSGRKIRIIILAFLSILMGIVLTCYYWLPLLVNAKYVTQTHLNYQNVGFQPFWDFIYSPWGLGFLYQGHDGSVKFILGYAHLIVIFLALLLLVKKLILKEDKLRFLFYLLSFFILFILMQEITAFVWKLPLLNNFRGSIRLLLFEAFFTGALAATVFKYRLQLLKVILAYPFMQSFFRLTGKVFLQNKKSLKLSRELNADMLIVGLCFIAVGSSLLHWANRHMLPTTDMIIQRDAIPFYATGEVLPMWLTKERASLTYLQQIKTERRLEVLKGKAVITELSRFTTKHTYKIIATTDVTMKENTLYFPGWTIFANGRNIPINAQSSNHPGLILFTLPKGAYTVEILFKDTVIREVSEYVGLSALISLALYPLFLHIMTFMPIPQTMRKKRK